jgi:hypothetical protein
MSVLKSRVTTAAAFGTTLFLLASAQALAQDSVPNLIGIWSGQGPDGVVLGSLSHREATPEPKFKDPSVKWTLTIERQDGKGLVGTWASPNKTERLIGVIRADRETVNLVDEDTYFDAILRSDSEMEVCLLETGGGSMVATCHILRRQ